MNEENLIPMSERSKSEVREIAANGGRNSGKSRREKKLIQEALQRALSGTYNVDNKKLGGFDALAITIIKQALQGNVQAFKEIRDTIEKPKDIVGLESDTLSGIKISFVDKSKKAKGKESDPKIIGDYTPPTNTEE